MSRYAAQLTVGYSAQQMFELVADVEHYPEFLDGWRWARVLRTDGDVRVVAQELGVGPLRWRFQSRALAVPHRSLRIVTAESPFRRLQIDWRFEAAPGAGTRVDFSAVAELRSRRLALVAGRLLETGFERTVDAFRQRADRLHGGR